MNKNKIYRNDMSYSDHIREAKLRDKEFEKNLALARTAKKAHIVNKAVWYTVTY